MNDNLLITAVKIAKIIDDNIERDEALSKIAQVQSAINYADDALETISQIRYVDIRSDAIRKVLDNLLTRFNAEKATLPNLDFWLEKLMDETLAIPNIQERCPRLQAIILFILPRLNNQETALALLRPVQSEFAQLDNLVDRSKYLFAVCEMFLQLNKVDEATAVLELIQERIADINSNVQQGLLLGTLAYEYWKMQDYMSAFECIGRIENREIQSYAYLQLVEMLSNNGQFADAEPIVEQQEEDKQKSLGRLLVNMGKNIFRAFPKDMKNIVFNINKSYVFYKELDKEYDLDSDNSKKPVSLGNPTWINHLLIIKTVVKKDFDSEQSESAAGEDDNQEEHQIIQENQIESYVQTADWEERDSDDDNEGWKESEDDEPESWKGGDDDDDGEDWKNSDDDVVNDYEDDEDVDESFEDDDEDEEFDEDDIDEDDDVSDAVRDEQDAVSDFINKSLSNIPFPEKLRKLHELFLEKVMNLNQNLNDIPKDKYYSLTETSQGIISYNQALPPKLLQKLLRKIFKSFYRANRNKSENEKLSPRKREKIEDFTNRMDEIGFDGAWQEQISQGDYQFAVECALNYFCYKHNDELVFGCEFLYP